jgi:hypothetical protein
VSDDPYYTNVTGQPVADPTKNVLDLVHAAIKRQDDLRALAEKHVKETLELHQIYTEKLREAETNRIDAIRAVDVGAVNRAAEVSAQQATTLAAQVVISAETLRTQVAAAASASTVALSAALEPIQKDIQDLRKAQYEAQGGKTQTSDTRLVVALLISITSIIVAVLIAILL